MILFQNRIKTPEKTGFQHDDVDVSRKDNYIFKGANQIAKSLVNFGSR
jgi:hypothetical protein